VRECYYKSENFILILKGLCNDYLKRFLTFGFFISRIHRVGEINRGPLYASLLPPSLGGCEEKDLQKQMGDGPSNSISKRMGVGRPPCAVEIN
jgi:hypothetical protein